MTKKIFTFLLLLSFLAQSCVTAKFTSNKDASYTKQPKKIFIMMIGAKQSKKFCNQFLTGLQNKLKEKSITTETYIHDPLALETDEDINKKINDYAPEAFMEIVQKEVHSTNNTVDGGKFELTLTDGETQKPVWKSEFYVYGQFGLTQAVDKTITELIKKMTEDKIIL